jgi:hypothetical protein
MLWLCYEHVLIQANAYDEGWSASMRKKEDVREYITAHEAAGLLSQKYQRPIRPDYVAKMSKARKHFIRVARFGRIKMYHATDILACTITQKRPPSRHAS